MSAWPFLKGHTLWGHTFQAASWKLSPTRFHRSFCLSRRQELCNGAVWMLHLVADDQEFVSPRIFIQPSLLGTLQGIGKLLFLLVTPRVQDISISSARQCKRQGLPIMYTCRQTLENRIAFFENLKCTLRNLENSWDPRRTLGNPTLSNTKLVRTRTLRNRGRQYMIEKYCADINT